MENMHAIFLLAATRLISVDLLSAAPGDTVATAEAKRVRSGQAVTLAVVIEAEIDGVRGLFADLPRVDLGRGPRDARPWPAEIPIEVTWHKVEPTSPWVDNQAGGFHWAEIPHVETPWPETGDARLSRTADVRATVLGNRAGLGTMRFKATVSAGGRSLATPGAEKRWRGGIADDVLRVSVRRDDSFLGYLTELFNTPYIWASAGDGPRHQAERAVGSDCADFIAYGLRRAGKSIEYGSTYDVPEWGGGTPVASAAGRGSDGRFVDARGKPIPVSADGVRPGDLLLFTRHVAALVADREPRGWLDANDLLIHTAWAPPAEESFEESSRWTSPPFTIWRVP